MSEEGDLEAGNDVQMEREWGTGWGNKEGVIFSKFSGDHLASEKEREKKLPNVRVGEKGNAGRPPSASIDDPLDRINLQIDRLEVKADSN